MYVLPVEAIVFVLTEVEVPASRGYRFCMMDMEVWWAHGACTGRVRWLIVLCLLHSIYLCPVPSKGSAGRPPVLSLDD